MKRMYISIPLVIAMLFAFSSCYKTASDMIVGHWATTTKQLGLGLLYYPKFIWEFDSDGKLRIETIHGLYEGLFEVDGHNIHIYEVDGPDPQLSNFINQQLKDGIISSCSDTWLTLEFINQTCELCFYRTNNSISETNSNINSSDETTISVSGDTWFVLDHKYSPYELIHLEKVTFGVFDETTNSNHQQLISRGNAKTPLIGQMYSTEYENYTYVYLYLEDHFSGEKCHATYGHVSSLADGFILDNADIILSGYYAVYLLNGIPISTFNYSTIQSNSYNTNMCLFANDEEGHHVV